MMSNIAIGYTVNEIKQLKEQRDKLDKQIESLENSIKQEMESQGVYEFSGDDWKVTWNMVTSNRFDQTEFKNAHPKIFEQYKKLSESRRFLIS